jgi:hypothetical protein
LILIIIIIRDLRASASVNEEKLQNELFENNKTLKKFQESKGDVSSMKESIKAIETKYVKKYMYLLIFIIKKKFLISYL